METRQILVTGATGEIGIPLVLALRQKYGVNKVVAGIHRKEPSQEIKDGPYIKVDVTHYDELQGIIKDYQITHLYHLSSVLSGTGEENPELAWEVNFIGLRNVLEAARKNNVFQVIYPSSIAAFGSDAPLDNTPNDTVQNPETLYGVSKVFGEKIGKWYFQRYGLDARGLRFPGIISSKEKPPEPPNGTTDALPLMIWHAVTEGRYDNCYLDPSTRLPMMYIDDAINALIQLSEADNSKLSRLHRTDYNVGGGIGLNGIAPVELAGAIQKIMPGFTVGYDKVSELHRIRQAIANGWPRQLDDSAAREEWGWRPQWDLDALLQDMIQKINVKLGR